MFHVRITDILRRSFGLLLALLNKSPRYEKAYVRDRVVTKPAISSLIITPHRDLAYQFLYWAKCMFATGNLKADNVESILRVVVRGASKPITTQVQETHDNPPHILVGTPQALLEALSLDHSPLSLRELSSIVVDEADSVLESQPKGKNKYALIKYNRMLAKHPAPTRQILDAIYRINRFTELRKHRIADAIAKSGEANFLNKLPSGIMKSSLPVPRPQLILTSATLKAEFRHSVFTDGTWLTRSEGQLAKVINHESREDSAIHYLGSTSISHSTLVCSKDGSVVNIKGAQDPPPPENTSSVSPADPQEFPATDHEVLSLEDITPPENGQEDHNSKFEFLHCLFYRIV